MAKLNTGINLTRTEVEIAGANGNLFHESMPSNLLNSEGIVSPEMFVQFLNETRRKNRINPIGCSLLLPSNATFFRTVESPIVPEDQLLLNLPYEFRDFVGSNSINYNYDYVVDRVETDNEGNPKVLHLLAAAGLKSAISEYAEVLKRAGYRLVSALPGEMCIYNLMRKSALPEKEYCLVGLDYDHTSIFIFKGKTMRASKTIELGISEIDKAISETLNVDIYLAGSYREKNYQDILFSDSLKNVYESISLEVMKTINFYRYEFNDTNLDTVYFFSMGADNGQLCETIATQLGFKEGSINELVPEHFRNKVDTARCLLSIGAIL